MSHSSRIFIRNRVLGYVSNHIPAVVRFVNTRKEHLVVTCVGKCFHTYNTSHLTLLTVSDPSDEDITCLSANNSFTFTAAGCNIYAWKRGTKVIKEFIGHTHPVILLQPFGAYLISVDESNILKVWDTYTGDLFLELTFSSSVFNISCLNHPSTYINKVLLGSEQGSLQLWNIKTSKLVYCFKGWDSAVLTLEQAPALDVTAIGLKDGKIILHNLKFDETIVVFCQDWGPVTCISFRTDGIPMMASGCPMGHIVLWDLEEKKVASQILQAHKNEVGFVTFLSCEPLMISSSSDNSLKMWIFDRPDGSGRLLRYREGHGAPPTKVRFHGNNGYYILSSGGDSSLRVFSTMNETFNYSLGKASYNKKLSKRNKSKAEMLLMPPIIDFTTETTRDKEWDSIAAVHQGIRIVTTWSFEKHKMGDLKLVHERFTKSSRSSLNVVATCISLTTCGNFVLIGYSSGHADRFNIQSGIHRCQYGDPSAHDDSVRGVVPDSLNQMVITGGQSGIIKFWPFKPPFSTQICKNNFGKLNLNQHLSFFRWNKKSSLLVVIADNDAVLVNVEDRKVVRRMKGHKGEITDAAFSPDCRWLLTASMDSTIRVWDIPGSTLIDIFKVPVPCTSLVLSPSGHLLATTHVNSYGIHLWCNKTLYTNVPLEPISEDYIVPEVELPSVRGRQQVIEMEAAEEEPTLDKSKTKSVDQIDKLITLSGLSPSRWFNLLDIDLIKKKNKPKHIEKPKTAPFFLPTLPSLDIKFDLSSTTGIEDSITNLNLSSIQNVSAFGTLLNNSVNSNNFSSVIEKLKSLGPSSVDFEIASLGLESEGSDVLLLQFMKLLNTMITSNKDFELAQSYLSLFLKKHGKIIASNPKLMDYLLVLEKSQSESWSNIEGSLMYLLSVTDALKKLRC